MKRIILGLTVCLFLILSSVNVFAGNFVQDAYGIKYDVGGGRYLEDGWAWCDPAGTGIGYSYYFSPAGYILVNTMTPDGKYVDMAGRQSLNGVVLTKMIDKWDYELETASYPAYATSVPTVPSAFNSSLASRIFSKNNAMATTFYLGGVPQYDAIEFTEGYNPFIMFNSGNNTSLTFDLTGDNLTNYDGDFVMDVYVNGVLTERYSQRFIELKTHTIAFAPNQNIEFRIPIINDYWEEYVRRVYVFNAHFN